MNKKIIAITLLIAQLVSHFTSQVAFASGKLLTANTSSEQDVFRMELGFDRTIDSRSVKFDFNNKVLLISVSDSIYKKNLPQLDPKTSFIKRLNFKDNVDKTVTLLVEFTDVLAQQMKENLAVEGIGKTLIIEILPPLIQSDKSERTDISIPSDSNSLTNSLSKTNTLPSGLGMSSTESSISNSKISNPNSGVTGQDSQLNTNNETSPTQNDEAKILLFENKKEQKPENMSLSKILFMVICFIAIGGYTIWYLKNKSKMVNGPESLMKIKLLTQFHLGPKKSLAVIRVAGESLLLSITETQVNLIKSLALLDEDFPELTTNDFEQTLHSDKSSAKNSPLLNELHRTNSDSPSDEEFSFGPAVKANLTSKIPILRKII